MSINRLQRPRLMLVGNGMAGMRTVDEGDKIYHTAEKLFPGPIDTRRHPSTKSLSGYLKLEKLLGCYPQGLAGIGEITHRRAGTRAGLEWNTDVAHRELDPTEGLHDHYFVKPAEMADAESLSIELIKPCAKR